VGVSVPVRTDAPSEETATLEVVEAGGSSPARQSRRSIRDLVGESWQLFPIEAIPDSSGREFEFRLVGEPEAGSIRLVGDHGGASTSRPVYTPALARLLDPCLARGRRRLPEVPESLERYLDRVLSESLALRGYGFLDLAHLADAIGRISEPMLSVLSVGAATGYAEAFLAGRLPDASLDALHSAPQTVAFPMPNLRFDPAPLPEGSAQYDLVFSLSSLQRLEDPGAAFRRLAAHVKPGKFLYVSAPLASAEEQRDPQRREAARQFGHQTAGFSFEDLEGMFEANGFDVIHSSSMFHLDLVLPLRHILESMSRAELECAVLPIARLLLWDLRDEKAASALHAEGLRVLGRMREA
jgi:SAM-dependent methyltransferase